MFHYLECEDETDEKILQFTKNNVAIIGNKKKSQQKNVISLLSKSFSLITHFYKRVSWQKKPQIATSIAWFIYNHVI